MKLEKAIGILSILLEVKTRLGKADEHDAIKLGIEAILRVQEFKKYTTPGVYMPLPGETKE